MKKIETKDWVGIIMGMLAIFLIAYYGFINKKPVNHENGYVLNQTAINESGEGYSITGSFPEMSGGNNLSAFNDYISYVINAKEDDFRQGLKDMNTSLLPPEMRNVTSTLIVNYSVVATSTDFVSLLFNSESYFVGMAHPSHAMDSVNFNLTSGKNISLGDIFIQNSNYLNLIADYSKNDILNQIKNGSYSSSQEYLDQSGGFLPDETNFQVFNITPQALIIHFQEYQAGPYVSGPAEVSIPWSILKDVLDPKGAESGLVVY